METRFALLPGDGIGPEVLNEARKAADAVAARFAHDFAYETCLIGGAAIEATGSPLPQATVNSCRRAGAILLGAVGGPRWSDPAAEIRPEQGLLGLRKVLGLFANIRPIFAHRQLAASSPLRPDVVAGVDILFYRELTGGIYFGKHWSSADGTTASSTMTYTEAEVERIVRMAGQAARRRRGKLTSVDKANVLEVSRLWRRTAQRIVEAEFSDLEYEVVLVDAMAMHLISRPASFDVVVTGNMFGDILTDEGSMLTGSIGMLPSASLGAEGPGLYEPIHGSAPDIAGSGIANPLAMILAVAMALRHSLHLETEAAAVEAAVDHVLEDGLRTIDIAAGGPHVGTSEIGAAVVDAVLTG